MAASIAAASGTDSNINRFIIPTVYFEISTILLDINLIVLDIKGWLSLKTTCSPKGKFMPSK
jgi:hypothetical protein